jgi:hypothetical protein
LGVGWVKEVQLVKFWIGLVGALCEWNPPGETNIHSCETRQDKLETQAPDSPTRVRFLDEVQCLVDSLEGIIVCVCKSGGIELIVTWEGTLWGSITSSTK